MNSYVFLFVTSVIMFISRSALVVIFLALGMNFILSITNRYPVHCDFIP